MISLYLQRVVYHKYMTDLFRDSDNLTFLQFCKQLPALKTSNDIHFADQVDDTGLITFDDVYDIKVLDETLATLSAQYYKGFKYDPHKHDTVGVKGKYNPELKL